MDYNNFIEYLAKNLSNKELYLLREEINLFFEILYEKVLKEEEVKEVNYLLELKYTHLNKTISEENKLILLSKIENKFELILTKYILDQNESWLGYTIDLAHIYGLENLLIMLGQDRRYRYNEDSNFWYNENGFRIEDGNTNKLIIINNKNIIYISRSFFPTIKLFSLENFKVIFKNWSNFIFENRNNI